MPLSILGMDIFVMNILYLIGPTRPYCKLKLLSNDVCINIVIFEQGLIVFGVTFLNILQTYQILNAFSLLISTETWLVVTCR